MPPSARSSTPARPWRAARASAASSVASGSRGWRGSARSWQAVSDSDPGKNAEAAERAKDSSRVAPRPSRPPRFTPILMTARQSHAAVMTRIARAPPTDFLARAPRSPKPSFPSPRHLTPSHRHASSLALLFTGQWADLPLEKLAPLVKKMGYDGVELACWGDHFDVDAAANSKKYVHEKWALLKDHGLTCYAISSHLVGQAVCDLIDEAPQVHPPARCLGRRRPRGRAQARRAQASRSPPRPRARSSTPKPGNNGKDDFPAVVNGFTGSSIWHSIYAFPPTSQAILGRRLRRLRQTLRPDPRGLRQGQRQLRPRSPPHRDRLRHREHAARDRRGEGPQALWFQLRPLAPRLPRRGLREVHPHLRQPASSTRT